MNIGIKYEIRRSTYNKQLQTLGSAILFYGKTNYYFTNPFVAHRVARYLNSKNSNFKYTLCKVPDGFIKNKRKISSYKEFMDFVSEKSTSAKEK